MVSERKIIFYTGTLKENNRDHYWEYPWGNICFILFYGSKINPEKAKTLLRLIFSVSTYEFTYNLPDSDIIYDSQFIKHQYNAELLNEGITFLRDEMFPTLMEESLIYEDIISEKYGGIEAMEERINTAEEQVTAGISSIEQYFEDDTETLALFCNALSDFFQEVLDSGTNYETELD